MNDKCFICRKELDIEEIYLCKEHTKELIQNYKENAERIVLKNPSEKEHCYLCGEWESREIIKLHDWAYICNICLNESQKAYDLE